MKVEIIAVGDEVLLGQTLDTNSNWIAKRVAAEGWRLHAISVVPDEKDPMLEAFRRAWHRSDVTIITGGLGPTVDDLTKPLLSDFFDLPLVFRNDILEQVREVYRKRQLKFIETSRSQAEFPEGAVPIRNRHGTAPGIWYEREGRAWAAVPGVPYEMKPMVEDFVLPRLRERRGSEPVLQFRTLLTYGIKEAALHEKLDNRQEVLRHTRLAFLPATSGVKIRLTVETKDPREGTARLDKAEELVREKVGEYIYATGEEESLEKAVGAKLEGAGVRVAVAESCTGGLLGKQLTDTPGSSAWFERGFLTYSNEAKQELLGVPEELLEEHGAVSAEVAEAMAEGALRASRAQVALSITGIAGPEGGTEEKPVGLVYIGLADARGVRHRRFIFDTDRAINRQRSADTALQMLMDYLLDKSGEGELTLI